MEVERRKRKGRAWTLFFFGAARGVNQEEGKCVSTRVIVRAWHIHGKLTLYNNNNSNKQDRLTQNIHTHTHTHRVGRFLSQTRTSVRERRARFDVLSFTSPHLFGPSPVFIACEPLSRDSTKRIRYARMDENSQVISGSDESNFPGSRRLSSGGNLKRNKVSRACDECRKRKVRFPPSLSLSSTLHFGCLLLGCCLHISTYAQQVPLCSLATRQVSLRLIVDNSAKKKSTLSIQKIRFTTN